MKTRIDIVYRDIKSMNRNSSDPFGDDPVENLNKLSEMVPRVNITKGNLSDLDFEVEKGSLYLTYLLQKNDGISFGICPDYKIWVNHAGTRSMCKGNVFSKRGDSYVCDGCLQKCPIAPKVPSEPLDLLS